MFELRPPTLRLDPLLITGSDHLYQGYVCIYAAARSAVESA